MAQRPILIVVHALGVGGVTNAIFDQSQLFVEDGHPTTILTLNYDPEFDQRVDDRRQSGRLNPAVTVRNAYQDIKIATGGGGTIERSIDRIRTRGGGEHRREEPGLLASHGTDKRGDFTRYFDKDGTYLKYKRWQSPGQVRQVTHFRDRTPVAKVDYNPTGWAHRRVTLAASGQPIEERFLTESGRAYLIRWIDPKTESSQAVYASSGPENVLDRHSGLPAWHTAYITSVCQEFDELPIVIAEAPSAVPKVAKVDPSVATRVGMLHNNQFAAPHTVGSPLRADHKEIFSLLPSLDALIVLTEQQKGDIVDLCGQAEKIRVIPNLRQVPTMPETVTKDPRLISVVSRLSAQKAIHEAIYAFPAVLRKFPDARLEIYGGGTTEGELRDVITEIGLEEQVLLMGRTPEPERVMAESLCTVSSSNWEAMPLSIVESNAVGTPVVAYDCLYGPRALIDHGRTGLIVPRGDREALAAAIVELLEDPARAAEMGRAARAEFEKSNTPAVVAPQWKQFLADL